MAHIYINHNIFPVSIYYSSMQHTLFLQLIGLQRSKHYISVRMQYICMIYQSQRTQYISLQRTCNSEMNENVYRQLNEGMNELHAIGNGVNISLHSTQMYESTAPRTLAPNLGITKLMHSVRVQSCHHSDNKWTLISKCFLSFPFMFIATLRWG